MAAGVAITNVGCAILAARMINNGSSAPSQTELKYCAFGTGGGSRTAAVTDTALTSQVETRTTGSMSTVTTTVTNDTYQVTGQIVATTNRTINEAGCFDASTSGNMGFSVTHDNQALANGDSITYTYKCKFVAYAA